MAGKVTYGTAISGDNVALLLQHFIVKDKHFASHSVLRLSIMFMFCKGTRTICMKMIVIVSLFRFIDNLFFYCVIG